MFQFVSCEKNVTQTNVLTFLLHHLMYTLEHLQKMKGAPEDVNFHFTFVLETAKFLTTGQLSMIEVAERSLSQNCQVNRFNFYLGDPILGGKLKEH